MAASRPGDPIVLDFELRPEQDEGYLELEFELDGKVWTRTIDVSESYLTGRKHREKALEAPRFGPFRGTDHDGELLRPSVPERDKTHPPIEARRGDRTDVLVHE